MTRPNWKEYAMLLAYTASTRSEDPWEKVGAAALRHDHTTLATGYNGVLPSMTINWTNRDERRDKVIHAERNLCNYIKKGEAGIVAVTLIPCPDCIKELALKGIKHIYYGREYTTIPEVNTASFNFANLFGITLEKLELSPSQIKKFLNLN